MYYYVMKINLLIYLVITCLFVFHFCRINMMKNCSHFKINDIIINTKLVKKMYETKSLINIYLYLYFVTINY